MSWCELAVDLLDSGLKLGTFMTKHLLCEYMEDFIE